MRLANLMSNNFYKVITPDWTVFFSYETPIGFIHYDGVAYVSENNWSRTTGKHINWIKDTYPNHLQIPHEQLLDIIDSETR